MASDYQKERFENGTIWKIFNDQGDTYYKITYAKEKTAQYVITQSKANLSSYINGKFGYLKMFELFKGTNVRAEIVERRQCSSRKELNDIVKIIIDNNDCINKKEIINIDREADKLLYNNYLSLDTIEMNKKNRESQKKRISKSRIEKIIAQKKAEDIINKPNFIPIHYEEFY